MIVRHSGTAVQIQDNDRLVQENRFRLLSAANEPRDGISDIVDVLRGAERSLHINAICEELSKKRGTKIVRTDVEPGLNRHVSKTKKARIAKYGPSIYGLPEWGSQEPKLAHSA